MGRSRAPSHYAEDDPNQRSKRKKTGPSLENLDTASTGHGMAKGKGALYHCNYCAKDISGKIRIKCVACPDFDLCIECFSVGAEVTPHKSKHPYRVMDNLSFPLICPDWNADEEILLLEGIEMYGFGNWNEVAEHVGTKSKSQCIDHYNTVYMNSPCFPLPDLSHVMGKSREELLAMAKGHTEAKTEFPTLGDLTLKEESSSFARAKGEESREDDPAHQFSSSITAEVGSGMASISASTFLDVVKDSKKTQTKSEIKVEESQTDRSIGEKKPSSGDEKPSVTELSGYNFKRQEFEIEYDNDAEQLLADMEFKDTDTDAEHELKLQVLRIYSKRLDERKRRRDFILERNLLYPDPFEKNLLPEERDVYQNFKVFMRFHSKEEHEELLKNVIEEHRIVKRIQDLQEARAAGCRTAAEANAFIKQKRKKEADESAHKVRESGASPRGVPRGAASSLDDYWDITGFIGADLLSEAEKQLCSEIRILPSHYLNMQETIWVEMLKGNVRKKSDAHRLFRVEPSKVNKVYDMLVKKGIAEA